MKRAQLKTRPLRAALRRLAPSLFLVWLSALPIVGEEPPLVVEIWPGRAPEESGNLGAERIVMSPKLDRKQVEVTEPTRMITDVTKPTLTIHRPAKDQDELAPGLRIPVGTPPVFLAHGGDDIISPPQHSVLMYLALKQAGVPAELHVYATAAHDFGVRASDDPCSTWTEACDNWLRHQGFLKPATEPR